MGPSGSVSAKSRSARNPVSASRRRRTDGGAPLRFSAAAGLPGGQVVIRFWAGFAALGAGLIHLAIIQEHLSEGWSHGLFFAVLGVLQIAWAAFALSSDVLPMPRRFAALNAAVILFWLVSRTAGLPVGPEPWEAEAVGTADLLCSGLEAALIALLIISIRPAAEESPSSTNVQRRMIVVAGLWPPPSPLWPWQTQTPVDTATITARTLDSARRSGQPFLVRLRAGDWSPVWPRQAA
jgi:hypothetical protein